MLQAHVFYNRMDWANVLADFDAYDFTHTYDFHVAYSRLRKTIPVIFAIKNNNGKYIMCWPILKRKIEGFDMFDFVGSYGDGGPLIQESAPLDHCLDLMFKKMRAAGGVTVFAQMHPLFAVRLNHPDLRTERWDDGILIDIGEQKETLRGYRSNHRRDIKSALANGVYTIADEKCLGIDRFMTIYNPAMKELGVRDENIFDRSFVKSLAAAEDFKTFFIFARVEDEDIGAMLLTRRDDLQDYFLGGVVKKWRNYSPLKVMIERGHRMAIEDGVRRFYLGSGPGEIDHPLIRFKKGFSKCSFPVYVCKKIINEYAYTEICAAKNVNPTLTNYMPAYRDPAYQN